MKPAVPAAPAFLPIPGSPASPASPAETRTAILDAAERLFAELGVEGASIRQITKAAGVNLAAVNYHFRTKDHLALEVFARRLEPVNGDRLARLDAVEEAAGKEGAGLEAILEAFIRPAVEDGTSGERREQAFLRLMCRCMQEPKAEIELFVTRQFVGLLQRFDAAILRAVPTLRPEDLFWRMNFLVGALHHSLSVWARFDAHPIPRMREDPPVRPDREGFVRHLVAFTAAGFRATSR